MPFEDETLVAWSIVDSHVNSFGLIPFPRDLVKAIAVALHKAHERVEAPLFETRDGNGGEG